MFLVVPLILGSIVGVQVGQKIGQFLDSSELKSLLQCFWLPCYSNRLWLFFRNKTEFNGSKVITPELNGFAEFIVSMSNDAPFNNPGCAWALIAWVRKIIHDLRYKKPKQEGVKFPVK